MEAEERGEPGSLSSEPFWRELIEGAEAPEPERIGEFRVLEQIGSGSYGVVYRARQDRPERDVAIKILRPGNVTPAVLRRFELEAQVLARLDHPGIAQIHATGVAELGAGPQPYFVMELIRGLPITQYAFEQGLGVVGKVELVIALCEAMSHAHQQGVIHRDLAPTNVLVDDSGRLRVVDFGLARVDADWNSFSARTEIGQVMGTVPYMSPEQISGMPSMTDARTDVYAIGVIAYELLTGVLPHDVRGKPLAEAARIICDEPARPAGRVRSELRGDLELVLAKALESEPRRRYQSVSELGADLGRAQRGEPVTAHAPSTLYMLRSYARRHRAVVAAGLFAIAALLAGTVASSIGMWRAVRAETVLADRYVRSQERVESLIKGVLTELNRAVGTTDAQRDLLLGLRTDLEEDLALNPENWHVRANLARVLASLGRLSLREGDVGGALVLQQRAFALREKLAKELPDNLEIQSELGLSYVFLGQIEDQEDTAAALELYMEALRIDESLVEREPTNRRYLDDLCFSYERVGTAELRLGRLKAAESRFLQRHQLVERQLEKQRLPSWLFNLCSSHSTLSALYQANDDVEKAEHHTRAQANIARELVRLDPTRASYQSYLASGEMGLAHFAKLRHEKEEALAHMQEAVRILRFLAESEPRDDGVLERTFNAYRSWAYETAPGPVLVELVDLAEMLDLHSPSPWVDLMLLEGGLRLDQLELAGSAGEEHRTRALQALVDLSRSIGDNPHGARIVGWVHQWTELLGPLLATAPPSLQEEAAAAAVSVLTSIEPHESVEEAVEQLVKESRSRIASSSRPEAGPTSW